MRTIIIGDIHGCNHALTTLVEKIRPSGEDYLVLLGDLFDRGPDSWEVFQTVMELADTFGERFALLLGNHEDYLLRPKLSLMERIVWDRVGRAATVASFRKHGEKMEDCIPWLKEHASLFWKGEVQCAHAGIKVDPIEANDRQTLLHDHDLVLCNQYAGPLTITGHIAIANPTWFTGDGENTKILPYETWRPLPDHGVICIDTGCGKGGNLTAMLVEGGQFRLEGAAGV